MKINNACKNYFNSFKSIKEKNSNLVFNLVKIASIFTLVIPLAMGVLWLISKKLEGRISKAPPSSEAASKTTEEVEQVAMNRLPAPDLSDEEELLPTSNKNISTVDFSEIANQTMTASPLNATQNNRKLNLIEKEVERYAITQEFGYKAANLMILRKHAKEMSKLLDGAEVSIPSFVPISNREVRKFLGERALEIDKLWLQFSKTLIPGTETISEEGLLVLHQIQNIFRECFSNEQFSLPKLEKWLNDHEPRSLIVRSTGMEDSDTNSNAGGNESVAYVERQYLSQAVGRVLSSYFSEKSIAQRLQAKDDTLFSTAPPFLPVLVQEMILEEENPDDDAILRSGVLFTYQQELARGTTVIQTGLGNNEGIVTSQVAVDSYYVDDKENIHAVVRNKDTRFVHGIAVDNRPNPTRQAALYLQQIKNLKRVANYLSAHYGKALDVEYSIHRRKLYLFQARPLISPETREPSYFNLTLLKNVPKENVLSTSVLIDTRQQVKQIKSDGEVLFGDDLKQAYKKYLRYPEGIHTIFIRRNAPSTSHEAIKLRERGITVVVLTEEKDYERAEEMIACTSEVHQVWIDPQHGLILEMGGVEQNAALLIRGNISYPLPRELTIPQGRMDLDQLRKSEEEYRHLLTHLVPDGRYVRMEGEDPVTLHRMLDQVATQDELEAMRALGSLMRYLHSTLRYKLEHTAPHQRPQLDVLVNLFQHALRIAQEEVLPAIRENPPCSMERLYPLKFLESVIYQQPSLGTVGGHSFAVWLNWDQQERSLLVEAQALGIDTRNPEALRVFSLGRAASYSKEMSGRWGRFVSSRDDLDALLPLLERLHQNHLLEGFVNIAFKQNPGGNLRQGMEDVLKEAEGRLQSSLPLFSENDIKKWGSPDYAERNIKALTKNYKERFSQLQGIYREASPLVKQAILQTVHEDINQYDLIIKQLTGSVQFPKDRVLQTRLFTQLLEGYFYMMQQCVGLLAPDDETWLFADQGEEQKNMTINKYLGGLNNGFKYHTEIDSIQTEGFSALIQRIEKGQIEDMESLYLARPSFSVEAMTIGSQQDMTYGLHWPKTLEEYFTLFHQNMEFIMSFEKQKNGLKGDVLDPSIQPTLVGIKKLFKSELATISKKGKIVTVGFNIPLRSHAVSIQLSYDVHAPEKGMQAKTTFRGANEEGRWNSLTALIEILQHSSKYKLSRPGRTAIDQLESFKDVPDVMFEVVIQGEEEIKNWLTIIRTVTTSVYYPTLTPFYELIDRHSIDLKLVPPSLFFRCPFYNGSILDWTRMFGQLGDEITAEFVRQYLRGLIKFRINDHTFHKSRNMLPDSLFDFVGRIDGSLKMMLLQEFVHNPKHDAQLIAAFPNDYPRLKAALLRHTE